jgi:hypothetical protein
MCASVKTMYCTAGIFMPKKSMFCVNLAPSRASTCSSRAGNEFLYQSASPSTFGAGASSLGLLNWPARIPSRNQTSAPARWVASSHADRELVSGL